MLSKFSPTGNVKRENKTELSFFSATKAYKMFVGKIDINIDI